MLYGRGAVLSYQYQRRSDAAAAPLPVVPVTTGREDAVILLRLCIVAVLAVGAAAVMITFGR